MTCEHCTRVSLTEAELHDLRYRRWLAKLPAKTVAGKMGVSHATLRRWEQGERRPTIDQHRRWIRALAAPD